MNKREQRRQNRFLSTVGLLLIAAALFLTGYNLWDSYRAGKAAEGAAKEVEIAIAGTTQAETEKEPETGEPETAETEETTGADLPNYVRNPEMEMPTVEINGVVYLGVIDIPILSRSLPVISEWSYPNLKIAPCRYLGSAYLDDLIIAAHNYASHFGTLNQLSIGDELTFTDGVGNMFHYTVAEVTTLDGTAIEEMQSGDWDLTLFTCTVGGKARVTVRCERQTEPAVDAE
jgi:sortase A